MLRRTCMIALAGFVMASCLFAQNQPPRARLLPQAWRKLDLSPDQKKKLAAIQDDYEPKIEELEKKVGDLKREERAKLMDFLTEEQKKKLDAINKGKEAKE